MHINNTFIRIDGWLDHVGLIFYYLQFCRDLADKLWNWKMKHISKIHPEDFTYYYRFAVAYATYRPNVLLIVLMSRSAYLTICDYAILN